MIITVCSSNDSRWSSIALPTVRSYRAMVESPYIFDHVLQHVWNLYVYVCSSWSPAVAQSYNTTSHTSNHWIIIVVIIAAVIIICSRLGSTQCQVWRCWQEARVNTATIIKSSVCLRGLNMSLTFVSTEQWCIVWQCGAWRWWVHVYCSCCRHAR